MSSRKGRKGRRRKMQGRVVGEPLLGAPRGILTGREALLPAEGLVLFQHPNTHPG